MASFSIRFGVLFTAAANTITPLSNWIDFRKQTHDFTPNMKHMFNLLLRQDWPEKDRADVMAIHGRYKAILNLPRKTASDLVYMKKTEKWVHDKFMEWSRHMYKTLAADNGFEPYERFNEGDGIIKHFIHPNEPENNKKSYYRYSQFFRYDFDHGADGPCLFVVSDAGIDHLMAQGLDMYHFLDLPSINQLNYEGLMASRQRMRPVAMALADVARQWWAACTAPEGCDPEALRSTMDADVQRLRNEFDPFVRADPDMQWLHSLMPDMNWGLGVWFALCPYPMFLECMDLNKVILPDTAKALAALTDVPGPPPYVPIVIISPGTHRSDEGEEPQAPKDPGPTDDPERGLRTLDID